jgi:regulator of protease activity HflC (stomatin/prohibitin superfamily)
MRILPEERGLLFSKGVFQRLLKPGRHYISPFHKVEKYRAAEAFVPRQANVIMRREETASTRSLLNTAKLMEENEILSRLKEFEYIERISEKINQITVAGGTQILDQLRQLFVPSEALHKAKNDGH